MKLELASFALCPYVHRATIMLQEKGAPYEIKYIDIANKPAWFLAISPRGKVPVLVAEGTPLFESAAINEFIDDTHAPKMMPEDPFARAKQRAWVEVANDYFMALYKVTVAMSDDDLLAARAALDTTLGLFEGAIRGTFFTGESVSLVDIATAPALYRATLLDRTYASPTGGLLAKYPKVSAWAKTWAARPSTTAGVLPTFGELYFEGMRAKNTAFVRQATAAKSG